MMQKQSDMHMQKKKKLGLSFIPCFTAFFLRLRVSERFSIDCLATVMASPGSGWSQGFLPGSPTWVRRLKYLCFSQSISNKLGWKWTDWDMSWNSYGMLACKWWVYLLVPWWQSSCHKINWGNRYLAWQLWHPLATSPGFESWLRFLSSVSSQCWLWLTGLDPSLPCGLNFPLPALAQLLWSFKE